MICFYTLSRLIECVSPRTSLSHQLTKEHHLALSLVLTESFLFLPGSVLLFLLNGVCDLNLLEAG